MSFPKIGLTLFFCLSIIFVKAQQGSTFFATPNGETFQQNAFMPSDSGVYLCLKKNSNSASLYWLINQQFTELKGVGSNYATVFSYAGTAKQWYTHNNKVLFVVKDQLTQGSAVWISDGTPNGTDTIFTAAYGTNVNIAGMIGNDLYFSSVSLTPYQTKIYKTDFTKAGTSVVKTISGTNLNTNYIDNNVLYLNGYIKFSNTFYSILYSFQTDTTRLLLGYPYSTSRVINGDLYYFGYGQNKKRNLTTNVSTTINFSTSNTSVAEIMGVKNGKLLVKANLSLTANDFRPYVADVNSSNIILSELLTNTGNSIPISSANFMSKFGINAIYFFGINTSTSMAAIYTTDGTNASTHSIQDLMTPSAWAFSSLATLALCEDRLYFYSADYKIGNTMQSGRALSTCDTATGSLSLINLNAGANPIIQDIELFQGKLLYSISSFSSKTLYSIDACSSPAITGIDNKLENLMSVNIYPNPNSGNFRISLPHIENPTQILIHNCLGELIIQKTTILMENDIDLHLLAGVYFVTIVNKSNKVVKKVLVN